MGEIEARLKSHPSVSDAVAVLHTRERFQHLVGYIVVVEPGAVPRIDLAEELTRHLHAGLPHYMIPRQLIAIPSVPLTANGKVDRKALPAPNARALAPQGHVAPEGELECEVAEIWQQLLGVAQVGRHDNFFALGGHSLLAIQVLQRLRARGLRADVRALFTTTSLLEFTRSLGSAAAAQPIPPNRIPAQCDRITPELLPLVHLTQSQIDSIAAGVPGGASNIQDIYPLTPLQHGIVFESLRATAVDRYLWTAALAFERREQLDRFAAALQVLVERHDILRTALYWQGLREPVQVVWRKAPLQIEAISVELGGDAVRRLRELYNTRTVQLDLSRAPLLRVLVAPDVRRQRWLLWVLTHHVAVDHLALQAIWRQIGASLQGAGTPGQPPTPFRNFVMRARAGAARQEQAAFFAALLRDVDAPTPNCGWPHGDEAVQEIRWTLPAELAARIHRATAAAAVSPASFWHLCYALLLARLGERSYAVFGSIVFGRMEGAQGMHDALGLYINTLPVRLDIGSTAAGASLRDVHRLLAQLLDHEHASLAAVQRCSAVPAPLPLFTALLNYRHVHPLHGEYGAAGIEHLYSENSTHYPLTVNIDVVGKQFELTVQSLVAACVPQRVRELLSGAASMLLDALEQQSEVSIRTIAHPTGACPVLCAPAVARYHHHRYRHAADAGLHRAVRSLLESARLCPHGDVHRGTPNRTRHHRAA